MKLIYVLSISGSYKGKHYQIINNLTKELGLGRPSIGMSDDYLHALDFNPKYIRLGTVLFGKRK